MKHAGRHIVEFSVDHPKRVVVLSNVISLALAILFPRAVIDTDPKHMLPVTSPVRQYNDKVEKDFGLHAAVIVLGIVNERGRDGLPRASDRDVCDGRIIRSRWCGRGR